MKISVLPGLNAVDVARRSGYGQVRDHRATEASYSRRLGSGVYPRFHIYTSDQFLNLHLDQKQASYEGSSAHSGEYEGEAVEQEARRIIEVMSKQQAERFSGPVAQIKEEKGGWLSRLFGKL